VYVWIGQAASKDEKRAAMGRAQSYAVESGLPNSIPIVSVKEGQESKIKKFAGLFA